jgi:transposase-like protein
VTGEFSTSGQERDTVTRGAGKWPGRKYTPEQIIGILRQVEVAVSNGRSTPQACRESGIVEQTYYRWRKEHGGLKLEQAKRLKALEKENTRLRHVVAELALEKQILKDVAGGNF